MLGACVGIDQLTGIVREGRKMKPPQEMTRIVDGKRYSVKNAELIADDAFWDGHNFERHGRNTFLFKTKNDNYFSVTRTQWQGERDELTPLTRDEAIALYEQLDDAEAMDFEDAFPGVEVVDA